MAEWMQGIFTGAPGDMGRVGIWGLWVMAVGLADVLLAKKIAARYFPEQKRENAVIGLKLCGVILMAVGALGAMKII